MPENKLQRNLKEFIFEVNAFESIELNRGARGSRELNTTDWERKTFFFCV